MSVITQTLTETATAVVPPVIITNSCVTITVTSRLATTLTVSDGEQVLFTVPPTSNPTVPTATETAVIAVTTTMTEFDVFLQNSAGNVFSTWTIRPDASDSDDCLNCQAPFYRVADPKSEGWDTWSEGQRAGLIVGAVLAAVLLFFVLLWCCRKNRNVWIAHG